MQNRSTHFEQVPLEKIRRMVEVQRKEITEQSPDIEKNHPTEAFLETAIMAGEV